MNKHELKKAHRACTYNEDTIDKSYVVGCFYCLRVYDAREIESWTDSPPNRTAVCYYCEIDSVIGDDSGYPVRDPKFLKEMRDFWFGDD